MNIIGTVEAGRRLRVSSRRVRQLIEAGRLRATRLGNEWAIDPADLQAVAVRIPGRPPKPKS